MSHPVNAPARGYLATKGVGLKFGGAVPKTVNEWVAKKILPPPDLVILGHKYWDEAKLDAYVHQRMLEGLDHRPIGQFDSSEANPRGKRLIVEKPDKRRRKRLIAAE
jgi:hypothetical protein